MELVIILVLILFNGLFSAAEISLVSSRKSKLEVLAHKGDKGAKRILKTAKKPDNFLSTVQIAITVIGFVIGLYSGTSLVYPFQRIFVHLGLSASSASWFANIAIVVVITYFSLVLGELFPKKVALNAPEKVASSIIRPMNFLSHLAWPFVWLLSCSTSGLMHLFRIKKDVNSVVTEDEIKQMINEGKEFGQIQEVEQDIVQRVFSLGDRDISSLMTHRNDFEWIEASDTVAKASERLAHHIHYIYPVAQGTLDNILGVVFLKDMFNHKELKIIDIVKQAQFVPESSSVYYTLEVFKKNKIHYALTIDEFGIITGMVTMNDILESLIGSAEEINTSENEYEIIKRDDGTFLVDGQYPFFDFLSYFSMEEKYEKMTYNTLSGLILDLIQRVPKEGDKIYWETFCFEIVDMDLARINKVLVLEK
jgi:Hemolysins and related proteins containing CBS domains